VKPRCAWADGYAKPASIPADAFSRTGPPRLVLITCGGPFDPRTGNNEDNIVGHAQPLWR
jgi:hypothetical protein